MTTTDWMMNYGQTTYLPDYTYRYHSVTSDTVTRNVVPFEPPPYGWASIEQVVEVRPRECEYCHSHCEDKRGNCGACGAPLP